jgi:hypothetical protein
MRRTGPAGAFLVVCAVFAVAQQKDNRGLQVQVGQLAGASAMVGRQYGVLIAINKYAHWNALRNPVKDAKEIKEILSRRYYVDEFIELYDEEATKAGMIKLFDRLIGITKPEDSVFIFYAGHGHLDKISDTGFWIPVDGGTDRYAQPNWLPNAQIRGFICMMKSRHVALVSDACFAGDILNPTRAISPEITEEYFRNAYTRVSRQVLTSGSSETVPDESHFARGLKLALEGNTSPYLDPLMLYNDVRLSVTGTTPLLGNLRDSGHQEGASFLLFLRKEAVPAAADAAGAGNAPPQARLKIEQPPGSIRISAQAAGQLFLDGALQGAIPAGSSAVLENVSPGKHQLELRYPDGEKEGMAVSVVSQGVLSVAFKHIPAAPPAAAASPSGSTAGPPAAGKPPSGAFTIPRAAIKIDGNFEDWNGITPAFLDPAGDALDSNKSVDIVACYLATDDTYLYVRIDIGDERKPSLFRPHNFQWDVWTTYQLYLSGFDTSSFKLGIQYNQNQWETTATKSDLRFSGKALDTISGDDCRLKGASLESRFPLSFLAPSISHGVEGSANVRTLISRDDSMVTTDTTEKRNVVF